MAEAGWSNKTEGVYKYTTEDGETATCIAVHPASYPLTFLCNHCNRHFTRTTMGKHFIGSSEPVAGSRPCKFYNKKAVSKEKSDGVKNKKSNKKKVPALTIIVLHWWDSLLNNQEYVCAHI